MPNSSTFILVNRAVKKCPISWTNTINVKTTRARRMPRKIDMKKI